ncbi:MAG TPA: hypothetical protein VNL77_23490 [Roseiflexaceae bacterium]|nr:hypothetical protein [Roseiflexaceae bacterium]
MRTGGASSGRWGAPPRPTPVDHLNDGLEALLARQGGAGWRQPGERGEDRAGKGVLEHGGSMGEPAGGQAQPAVASSQG